MNIKNYLAILIVGCLAGTYFLEYLQAGQFNSSQRKTDEHYRARLWLHDLKKINADTSQYLISTDLVIGSGQSYLVAGTRAKGDLIAQNIEQLAQDNQLLPETESLINIARYFNKINIYLEQVAIASSIDRDKLLIRLLHEYDEIALQLSQQMQEQLNAANQLLADNKTKLDQLHEDSGNTQITTRILYSLFLLLLWYWANRKICTPVTRLSHMADTALKGYVFEGIKHGPKETLQLSANLSALTNSLSFQANHDYLTSLYNRRAFQRILISSVSAVNDRGSSSILCFIDLDRFKMVNDTCGHAAGDQLLIQVAQLLQEYVRDSDCVARLGGDEFAVLLHGCSISAGLRISNKIRSAIRDIRFLWEGDVFTISASIGITPFTASANNRPKEIINTADMACKQAKESGRDNVQVFDSSNDLVIKNRDEIMWVNKLNTAIEQGHFVLFKQNIVAIGNAQESGSHFEILIRMMGNDNNLLLPGIFVPIAERYHLSLRLDTWVVNATIEWFLAHPDELDKLSMCSINLSGQSVGNKDIRNFIIKKLRITNFPAEKLCFEITETAAVTDLTNARLLIDELRALGCKFSLDDFGSGLSSFAYLKELPVDIIKIDGAFVKDMMSDKVNKATVEAINGVAKAVGKQTIAEFVEDADTLRQLEKIGVDFAQGYHFHKAEPLKDQAMIKPNVKTQRVTSKSDKKLNIVS